NMGACQLRCGRSLRRLRLRFQAIAVQHQAFLGRRRRWRRREPVPLVHLRYPVTGNLGLRVRLLHGLAAHANGERQKAKENRGPWPFSFSFFLLPCSRFSSPGKATAVGGDPASRSRSRPARDALPCVRPGSTRVSRPPPTPARLAELPSPPAQALCGL